ncbi:muts domain V-domain-containing protein [Umbelopsis sp. AD052]|nr:muts domain V-domain-containing protein [Umbelopsis sp. AD052]
MSLSSEQRATSYSRPPTSFGYQKNDCILAMAESRGVATEIGLCFINMHDNTCYISQIADTQTYVKTMHMIHVYNPNQIIVIDKNLEEPKSKLCKFIYESIQEDTKLVPVSRRLFNDVTGLEYNKQLLLYKSAYAENFIAWQQQRRLLDALAARNLELITSLSNGQSNLSLFGILNHTSTQMGGRLLRISILQPLNDISKIEARLDAVEEMSQNEDMFFGIKKAISSFADLDKAISMIIKKPLKAHPQNLCNNINQLLILKSCLEFVKPIVTALGLPKSALLLCIKETMEDSIIGHFLLLITESIEEDAGYQKSALGMRHQRCYAVKSDLCGMLDVARQTYREAVNDIYDLVASYCEETSVNIKTQFSEKNGFYLSLPVDATSRGNLPEQFISVIQKKRQLHFTSIELLQLNYRVSESLSEIYKHSDSYVNKIMEDIRSGIHILYKFSEAIALLDICVAFTHMCTVADYVRPEFSDTLAIKAGRHPIRERVSCSQFVPNDIFASDTINFQIVTGPNMSGKSTYLRTIAMLVIMAHIGSFVPAKYASFRPTDYLFTRLPVDDSAESGISSFMVEMRDVAYMLQNVTDSSLIIMDEMGRATSTCDALAITTAVCEELIHTKAFVFFATHLHELTYTLDVYPNVVKLQLMVDLNTADNQCSMRFHYLVQDGRANPVSYGLQAAQMLGLPDEIVQRAYTISNELQRLADQRKHMSSAGKLQRHQNLTVEVVEKLRLLPWTTMSDEMLHDSIENIKNDYLSQVEMFNATSGIDSP